MKRNPFNFAIAALLLFSACVSQEPAPVSQNIRPENISIESILMQDAAWYQSKETMRIAENVMIYQLATGGWQKDTDMIRPLSENETRMLLRAGQMNTNSTFDNDATTTQIRFLAKMYNAQPTPKILDSISRGLDFIFTAQYDNGGWPQDFPNPQGYHAGITFNDDAITNNLYLLQEIATSSNPDFKFLKDDIRKKAAVAVKKGIECILKTQIVVDNTLTGWCAQYDPKTLAPALARSYEHPSISGLEGVSILRFLMSLDNPSPQMIKSIQAGVAWFDKSALKGIYLKKSNIKDDDFDFTVEKKADAPPLWARFYEIKTNRPIFSGRDGIIKYDVSEIEQERRYNYRWYTDAPLSFLRDEYPVWQQKWAPGNNVLKNKY
ncbi:MAG: pectate lyase [Spirochaetales bacterium]|nr:pectate lyase [Spirochaetales bacterium]